MKKKLHKKVLVCLSGGVDSSVAALLLVQQGYDVTGAYMKQWSDTKGLSGVCSWKEDRREAVRVAAHLGIPLLTLDFEKEYKQTVVDYLFTEYEKGNTPNPDVMCNKYVKFGFWLKKAKKNGFDYLATGHYAQVVFQKNIYHLRESVDEEKDQTYFLHQLDQDQLAHVLFPIGGLKKKQVRMLAHKAGLPTANRAESMGICFIGEIPMKDFLLQKIKPKKGNILFNETIIGKHEGLPFYTIGQRHGFSQPGGGDALFVVEKDLKTNSLLVGTNQDARLSSDQIAIHDVSWVSGQSPIFPLECFVRLRHRQALQKGFLHQESKDSKKFIFKPNILQKSITPGQFAVFYKNGECLGGGVIVERII